MDARSKSLDLSLGRELKDQRNLRRQDAGVFVIHYATSNATELIGAQDLEGMAIEVLNQLPRPGEVQWSIPAYEAAGTNSTYTRSNHGPSVQ